jgi:hypothetical protein
VDREPLLVERLGCSGNGFDGARDPRGLTATRLTGTFHIVTMPVALRRALVQAVESAGLEIARLSSTLPAALAGMADERMWTQRLLVLDGGGLSTEIGGEKVGWYEFHGRISREDDAGRRVALRAAQAASCQGLQGGFELLLFPHPGIVATEGQQLVVRALLGDAAAFEQHDEIGMAHDGQAMRDEQSGSALHVRAERLEDADLCFSIDCGQAIVQHQDRRLVK